MLSGTIRAFQRAAYRVTPAQKIADELAQAELALLDALTGKDWAESQVAYNKARVKRLKASLEEVGAASEKETVHVIG
jgi:hypothetical protein